MCVLGSELSSTVQATSILDCGASISAATHCLFPKAAFTNVSNKRHTFSSGSGCWQLQFDGTVALCRSPGTLPPCLLQVLAVAISLLCSICLHMASSCICHHRAPFLCVLVGPALCVCLLVAPPPCVCVLCLFVAFPLSLCVFVWLSMCLCLVKALLRFETRSNPM